MAALGCNPLVAIQIALKGNAANMIKRHVKDATSSNGGGRVDTAAQPALPKALALV